MSYIPAVTDPDMQSLNFSTVSFTVADGVQHNTLPVTTAFSDKLSGKKNETQNFRKFKKQMKR